MFKRLIIAADLSKDSNELISCLGALKVYGAEKCLLLQVRTAAETLGIDNAYEAVMIARHGEFLENQKKILEKQGLNVEARALAGTLTSEINRIAKDENYSAVVVGAEKHTSIGEVYFSDLANDLIHVAQKPILLIRLRKHVNEGTQSCTEITGFEIGNHVLFATDFSENADVAFPYVVEMAADKAKKITLLHVQDRSRISPYLETRIKEFNEIDNGRLQSMKEILQEKGRAQVDTVLKFGSPSVEILNFVKEQNVQLVVMGSQGRGFVKEFFLGSVSHNIARSSPSSVLLIPAKR